MPMQSHQQQEVDYEKEEDDLYRNEISPRLHQLPFHTAPRCFCSGPAWHAGSLDADAEPTCKQEKEYERKSLFLPHFLSPISFRPDCLSP